MRISVVIIFCNAADYLREAIESVRIQGGEWDLTLVDDGSTDGGPAIAEEFLSDSRVSLIRQPNRGMSAARNRGVEASSGEYVFFLDADDVLRPAALVSFSALLDAWPAAGAVYGPIEWWDGSAADGRIEAAVSEGPELIAPPRLLARYLGGRIPVPSGLMFRRDAVLRVGGFVEQFTGLFEDQAFLVKLLLSEAVVATPHSFYRYRRHASASTGSASPHALAKARRRFRAWTVSYLLSQKVSDPRVWSALARGWVADRYRRAFQ